VGLTSRQLNHGHEGSALHSGQNRPLTALRCPAHALLVLVAAVIGVAVNVWLERKDLPPSFQQRIGLEICRRPWVLQPLAEASSCSGRRNIIPGGRPMACCSPRGPILVLMPGDPLWLVIPFGQNHAAQRCGHRRVPLERPQQHPADRPADEWLPSNNSTSPSWCGCGRRPVDQLRDSPLPGGWPWRW